MTLIAHMSDLHVWGYQPIAMRKYLNKRLVGGVNIALNRNDVHQDTLIFQAFEKIRALNPDHVCISGDLTNLSLPGEFHAAREVVDALGFGSDCVSVIPGNHDYYTSDSVADRLFEKTFSANMTSDLPQYQNAMGYPFVRFTGDTAVVSLSSGVVSPPLFAYGKVGRSQLNALDRMLADPELRDRAIVAQVHHHPLPYPNSKFEAMRDLRDAKPLLQILRRHDVCLVMHGHNHDATLDVLPTLGNGGQIAVSGSGSTSTCRSSKPNKIGSFKIYEISNRRVQSIETHFYDPIARRFSRVRKEEL